MRATKWQPGPSLTQVRRRHTPYTRQMLIDPWGRKHAISSPIWTFVTRWEQQDEEDYTFSFLDEGVIEKSTRKVNTILRVADGGRRRI